MNRPGEVRALDCTSRDDESASVEWLTHSRVTLLDDASRDCSEPNLAGRLAADHYTHLLVRSTNRAGRAFFERPLPAGLQLAARVRGAQVFAVTAAAPPVLTGAMTGFWPREHDTARTWRWMQDRPLWIVTNTRGALASSTLDVELSAAASPRQVRLELDGRVLASFVVAVEWRVYRVPAFTVSPGAHQLAFLVSPADPAYASGDPRPLSCALGSWTWTVEGAE
jgi:hypothetical protein